MRRARLGIGPGDRVPSESTIRRTLAAVDPQDLDRRLGAWAATRVLDVDGRAVIPVDGKSMRGAAVDGVRPRLLSALTHTHGVVLAQRAVADKGSEIPELKESLAVLDLTGVVVTIDALHTHHDTATWLAGRGADYVMTVKGNQPSLRTALKALPWSQVTGHTYRDRGHGRRTPAPSQRSRFPPGSTGPARPRSCRSTPPETSRVASASRSYTRSARFP